MAATHPVATRAASDFPMFAGRGGGNLKAAYGTYTIATALDAASTVDLFHLPSGAVILGGYLVGEDLDTGAGDIEIDIGTRTKGTAFDHASADPDKLLNSGKLAGGAVTNHQVLANIFVHLSGSLVTGPVVLTADTTVFATITAAAAAGGTGTFWVRVDYLMP